MSGMNSFSRRQYHDDAKKALEIAKRFRTHREAVADIIRCGLAEDAAEADTLIYEGEVNE